MRQEQLHLCSIHFEYPSILFFFGGYRDCRKFWRMDNFLRTHDHPDTLFNANKLLLHTYCEWHKKKTEKNTECLANTMEMGGTTMQLRFEFRWTNKIVPSMLIYFFASVAGTNSVGADDKWTKILERFFFVDVSSHSLPLSCSQSILQIRFACRAHSNRTLNK